MEERREEAPQLLHSNNLCYRCSAVEDAGATTALGFQDQTGKHSQRLKHSLPSVQSPSADI